jgi:hypothetical protein
MPAEKTEGQDTQAEDGKAILKALQSTAKGLLFPSESDRPVSAFLWENTSDLYKSAAVDESAFKAAGKVPDGSTIKSVPLETFFEPVIAQEDWWGDEEKAQAKHYQELIAILKDKLTGVTVFRVAGSGDEKSVVNAFVVGRTVDGSFAGVSTQLIET